MLIDTHAHLFFPNFDNDLDQVIENAKASGVKAILVPGTDLETSKKAIELSDKYEMVYAAVGVHPHDTKDWESKWVNDLRKLAEHKKVVAIGEIGLDYFYDYSPKEKQIEAFKQQIALALKLNFPIIVHNRDSNEDLMEIIREYKDTNLKAQFHCFAGSAEDAKELVEMGHFISFTGNITFKSRQELRDILLNIKPENLLLETDSPFMTPVPFRGKRNEPAHVNYVAEKIAEIHDLTKEEVGKITSQNVFELFGIGE
ncbi:MAG: TatD family hydrolase [Ignavibacteria bacterium]|jgi:TatD DNase family protein